MTLPYILVSIIAAILLGLFARKRWRVYLLGGISALAVFAFQPVLPIRGLDFWFPVATLALTSLSWIVTTPREHRSWSMNWLGAAIICGVVFVLGLTRYFSVSLPLTPSRPPQNLQIILVMVSLVIGAVLLTRFTGPGKLSLNGMFIFVILLFIILKVPFLELSVSKLFRSLTHQSTELALAQDIRWLGISYICFRLLHTIRDRQNGRLPVVTLSEYLVYIIFFPTLSSGPIDRIERFILDLRRPFLVTAEDIGESGKRLVLGLFKKFAIADVLGIIALNQTNAFQVQTSGWAWILLYAYAFQIYFDFSGYTDIAIGLGRLIGFKLPENFNSPYFKPNITLFWSNWHITLTQWFRAYFYYPLTRVLRTGKKSFPVPVIIFITQMGTMILIGIWHGFTLNFILWGAWHGLGLFIHNRWAELTRGWFHSLSSNLQTALNVGGVILTFNFVALGWVFFALPKLSYSVHYLSILFGRG